MASFSHYSLLIPTSIFILCHHCHNSIAISDMCRELLYGFQNIFTSIFSFCPRDISVVSTRIWQIRKLRLQDCKWWLQGLIVSGRVERGTLHFWVLVHYSSVTICFPLSHTQHHRIFPIILFANSTAYVWLSSSSLAGAFLCLTFSPTSLQHTLTSCLLLIIPSPGMFSLLLISLNSIEPTRLNTSIWQI